MLGNFPRTLLALAALALGACTSTSYTYHFEPTPAEAIVASSPDGPALARVLVGVMGAERRARETSGHPDLVVRLRIEAKGAGPIGFDPASAQVLGPDLAEFGPAFVDGGTGPIEVPRNEARDLTLRFAFPRDGDLRMPRLTGVNVSFQVQTPAGPHEVSVSLARNEYERRARDYYDDGPSHWHWHFGYFYGG